MNNKNRKFFLYVIIFSSITSSYASYTIDQFEQNIINKYNKNTVYVKIFVYGVFSPDMIKELKNMNYTYADILMLNSIFMYIEDNFSKFREKIKNKDINKIIDFYNIDETAVITTAREILATKVNKSDLIEYDNYSNNRFIYFSIATGCDTQIQFSNFEYSYFTSAGISIIPAEFISIDLKYKLSSIPIENTNSSYVFNINKNLLLGYLTLVPFDSLNINFYTSYGTGNYDYKYNMNALDIELDFEKFSIEGEIKKSSEEYINDDVNNTLQTFKSINYLGGITFFLTKNISSIEFQYTYINNENSEDNWQLSLNLYYNNFSLYYDYVHITEEVSSHTINPDFIFNITKNITLNTGGSINIYTTTTEITTTIFTSRNNSTQKSTIVDFTFNYSAYLGLELNF